MSNLLDAAFAHHAWATTRILDACEAVSDEALAFEAPGTRGDILSTLRHLIGSDPFDLWVLTRDPRYEIDEERLSLDELRAVAELNAEGWRRFLDRDIDPDEIVLEVDPNDGFEREAPVGFRLAGVLQHGSDHRSQLCTALTLVGVTPPNLGVMDFGVATGRVVEQMPGA
jgi:uncharacterized damage-inducible protein DinB